jgi:hypothetical protein
MTDFAAMRYVFCRPSVRSAALIAVLASSCTDLGPDGPGQPTTLAVVSGDAQSAIVASALPITIRVLDKRSRTVPNVSIQLVVTSGDGQLSTATAVSNDSGLVRVTWTLGTVAGEQALEAHVASDASVATIVHATAKPDVPASLKILTRLGPTVINAEPIAADLRVAVVDRFGNTAPSSGIAIAASLTGVGQRELRGTANATTDGSGVGAFSQLAILGDTGSTSLVFQAASLAAAVASLRVVAGAPVRVVATSIPTSVVVTAVIPISARVTDVSGNPVPKATVVWSIVIGNGAVTPATAIADDAGMVSATLALGTVSGPIRLRAVISQTSLGSDFTVTALPGAFYALTPPYTDSSLRVNTPFSGRVRAIDSYGNPIPGISLRPRSGGIENTSVPTPPMSPVVTVTDADGYATFSAVTAPQPGLQVWVVDGPGFSAWFRVRATGDRGYITPWNGTPIDGLTWKIGSLAKQVGFIVMQANGFPASNVLVSATLDLGNGIFVGGSAGGVISSLSFSGLTTPQEGLVSIMWNPPSVAGTYTMKVQAPPPNDGGSPLVVTLRVVP